jgi:hypothetical protein
MKGPSKNKFLFLCGTAIFLAVLAATAGWLSSQHRAKRLAQRARDATWIFVPENSEFFEATESAFNCDSALVVSYTSHAPYPASQAREGIVRRLSDEGFHFLDFDLLSPLKTSGERKGWVGMGEKGASWSGWAVSDRGEAVSVVLFYADAHDLATGALAVNSTHYDPACTRRLRVGFDRVYSGAKLLDEKREKLFDACKCPTLETGNLSKNESLAITVRIEGYVTEPIGVPVGRMIRMTPMRPDQTWSDSELIVATSIVCGLEVEKGEILRLAPQPGLDGKPPFANSCTPLSTIRDLSE